MNRRYGRAANMAGLLICAAGWLLILRYIPARGPSLLDRRFAEWIAGTKSDFWTTVWKVATVLGNSSGIIALTLILTAVAARYIGIRKSLWIPGGVAAAFLLNFLMKAWVDRPRPDAAWGIDVDGASFPSGNAMLALVLYGLIAALLRRYGRIGKRANRIIALLAAFLIVIMGWSRLYFSVHYVTDIAAGYAAGGVVCLTIMLIAKART